ncbi:MAG: hypothetical protein Q8S33_25455 [Myxococcales bacterium]|nr:hypothetical protein [Myxococcales bacterium]
MTVGAIQPSSPVVPQQDSTTTVPGRSNAQSDAAINSVTSHLGAAALDAMAKPDFFQSLAADAPKLLLGLIPVVGPIINLVQIFSKVAEYSGTATPAQNAPVIPNKTAVPQKPAKREDDEGELRASAKEILEVEHTERGSFGDATNGGSGSLTARARLGARADAVATTTATGARAAAGAAVEADARIVVEGEIHGSAGKAKGKAQAYARAHADVRGSAEVDVTKGATLKAGASSGAEAGADAQVCAETAPIVKFGGYDLKAGANASGYAVSGTGASCSAEATATFNPPEIVGQVGARAFAGARAGAQARLGTGPFKLDVGIDARAGAGVEYGLDFSFKDGKLSMKGFAGIAAAVGLGTNFNLSIDFNELGSMVAGIFGQVAMDAPKGSPGQAAAAGIADFVKFATPFVAKAAEKYSSVDLLNGEGTDKTERSGTVKRDDPALSDLSQKERDAIQEADLARGQQRLDQDLKNLGNGSRSSLDSRLV